jgi:hypothetical protein
MPGLPAAIRERSLRFEARPLPRLIQRNFGSWLPMQCRAGNLDCNRGKL